MCSVIALPEPAYPVARRCERGAASARFDPLAEPSANNRYSRVGSCTPSSSHDASDWILTPRDSARQLPLELPRACVGLLRRSRPRGGWAAEAETAALWQIGGFCGPITHATAAECYDGPIARIATSRSCGKLQSERTVALARDMGAAAAAIVKLRNRARREQRNPPGMRAPRSLRSAKSSAYSRTRRCTT